MNGELTSRCAVENEALVEISLSEGVNGQAGPLSVLELALVEVERLDETIDEVLAARVDAGRVEVGGRERSQLALDHLETEQLAAKRRSHVLSHVALTRHVLRSIDAWRVETTRVRLDDAQVEDLLADALATLGIHLEHAVVELGRVGRCLTIVLVVATIESRRRQRLVPHVAVVQVRVRELAHHSLLVKALLQLQFA